MIKYKITPSLKNYLQSFFIKLKIKTLKSTFKYSFICSLILFVYMLVDAFFRNQPTSFSEFFIPLILMLLFVSFVFFLPTVFLLSMTFIFLITVFKYLLIKFYYKAKYIEYFFNKDEFGWEVLGNKLSYKRELIKSIKAGKDYLLIKLNLKKIELVFFSDVKTTSEIVKKLKESEYKKFLIF